MSERARLYSVSDFVEWQANGTLELSPSFQRRPVWSQNAKSLLLDTVVRGLPTPIVFLRERTVDLRSLKTVRQVVDGQQRIRTLFSYVRPSLLEDYEPSRDDFTVRPSHNKSLAGKRFDELDEELRRRILNYQFNVYGFPPSTADQELLQIFARLNSTGVRLNSQELRNAEFEGEFKAVMYALAAEQLERWRHMRIFSETDIARMLEVELTSELALLMFSGISAKTSGAVDALYKKHELEFREAPVIEERFAWVMDALADVAGDVFARLEGKHRTLFYASFAATYDKRFGLGSALQRGQHKPMPKGWGAELVDRLYRIENGQVPARVLEATARRTTHKGERQILTDFLATGNTPQANDSLV